MTEESKDIRSPLVLIADDDLKTIDFLEVCLKEKHCQISSAYDGENALNKAKAYNFDLILLNARIPRKDGLEVCRILKSDKKTKHIPIIMITGADDSNIMMRCFEAGADEFLVKPFTPTEILARTNAMLRIKLLYDELLRVNSSLLKKVDEKTKEWHSVYTQTAKAIADAVDAKDSYTENRSNLVAEFSVAIAREMGLGEPDIEKIRQASELHDLGKITIHDAILEKKGKLTKDEWKEIKKHSSTGVEILESLLIFEDITDIIKQHHERYDGKGYPLGKKGEEIPLGARIIAAADAYESMTSDRPHRKALAEQKAMKELRNNAGKQFDPKVVKIFLKILEELQKNPV